jgi:hypothetical protein
MSRALTPFEMMIDKACGHTPKPPEPPPVDPKEVAKEAANEAIWHIDTMYPKIWLNVPKSARRSIRNTIYNKVLSAIGRKGGE